MKRIILFMLALVFGQAYAKVTLPKFFSSHMVLQREAPITIYGWADKGKTVSIEFAGKTLQAKADNKGEWSITFPAMQAGGPYTVNITEDNKIIFNDVYIGDVWFCSGQSNMGWKLENAVNGEQELANASHEKIKLLQVSRTMAGIPQNDIEKGSWATSSPQSAEGFSAVAYFFGRELYNKYQVPIGLINSSWGGTNIEAWLSADVMGKHPEAAKTIAKMKGIDFSNVMKDYKKDFDAWNKKADNDDVGLKQQWYNKDYDTKSWKNIELPVYWKKAKVEPNDGIIWVTREFTLTERDLTEDELTLSIGRVDNEDITYINGNKVAESTNKDLERVYNVAKENFTPGKNIITIRVKNSGDVGGFRSDASALYLQTPSRKISLAGTWRYEAGTKDIEPVPVRQHPTIYPTSLYNGMVAPFFGIKIKGIIWYQGEANSKNAAEYASLFKAMITDWRNHWGQDYPFIFAQLPNYDNQNGRWITLRESQSKALELKNTGMVTLIDVGEDDNIHPINKQEPGRRFAVVAQNVAYGDKLPASAPVYTSYKQDANAIFVTFNEAGFELKGNTNALSGFTIAGSDKKFYPANASLQSDGKTIKVWSDKVQKPAAVRYLWADAPGKVMLYNKDGLATPPFRTDNW
ncbi:sialate O-acetylesterase [Flavobacterium sp. MK4S-17]|uniref:sialate O-acetylesterase n=1 Tax=Flavobacterium sp. MK4S-17 TaxID=2543737 RepID=UPI00135A3847|nr:sialate O-acetylesterase [Flavobacterium sp. MK4S-17]